MGILGQRLKFPYHVTVAAHTERKMLARESREERQPTKVQTWWVIGVCTDEGCVEERKRNKHAKTKQQLCQICRLCNVHCLGHRGILDGLRPVLTVHSYT